MIPNSKRVADENIPTRRVSEGHSGLAVRPSLTRRAVIGKFSSTVRLTSLLAIGCIGLVGCGGQEMADVAGRIVYAEDGEAATDLAGFRVSFLCNSEGADGKAERISATGLVRKDATFTLSTYEVGDGVVLGTHEVAVTPPVSYGDNKGRSKPIIDPRFSRPDQSGLTTVVDGNTEVVLKVQRAR